MTEPVTLTRREFLVRSTAVGGGLLLGFHLPVTGPLAADSDPPPDQPQAVEVNAWIVIQADNRVVIRVARSEMGQGIFTALPMLIAEELGCDWDRVSAEYASASDNLRRDNVYVTMATGGSRSVRGSQEYLRTAGAAARELLVASAAQRWGVAAGECRAENSQVIHKASNRKLSYGELAAEAARLPAPEIVFLKDPDEWTLIGKPVKRLDVPDKVAGRAVFAADVEVPGMLHAAIRACPVFGGRLKHFDAAAINKRPGVERVLALEDAVVVVADSWWQAQQALDALPVEWDAAGNGKLDDENIRAVLEDGLTSKDTVIGEERGDVAALLRGPGRQIEASYYAPYLAHATMEPMTCTAHVRDGRVEVWAPTQNASATLKAAARAANVDPLKVEVHNTQLGGGFGRRGAFQDSVEQAVRIAKLVGRPIKLLWTREEDMQHDFYRPASMARLTAAIDSGGRLAGLRIRVSAPSILAPLRPKAMRGTLDPIALQGFADPPYAVPHLLAEYALRELPVPLGFWRSVNHSQNAYFRECFLDQVARESGQDPFEFRAGLLADAPRQLAVLKTAADKAGWGQPLPERSYRGIALETSYGSHCAQVAEVRLNEDGSFKLLRVVCAIDPGHVVNPDTVEAQVESAIVYGLTAALFGDITLREGRVVQGNFHDYPMLLLKDMPAIETHIVASGGFWGGIGEPPLPPIAPAVCNALYAATGRPIHALPLSAQGLHLS
ncbi:MAG: xanthine dehydrogenase family protein molybdopterin-binding subunit [Pseudomonadota bacterium]|nr:xanthine dehydrogenase family protein molybdopterin-binding subunit [Pseudomonadota bacterium]